MNSGLGAKLTPAEKLTVPMTNPAEAVDEIDSRAAVAARRKKNRRCNFMVGSKK